MINPTHFRQDECYNCEVQVDSSGNIKLRSFDWIVTPSVSHVVRGCYLANFNINLCEWCYSMLDNDNVYDNVYTIGQDWLEASIYLLEIINEKINSIRKKYWIRFKKRGY